MIPAVCPLVVAGSLTTEHGTSLQVLNTTARTYTITSIKVGIVDVDSPQLGEYSEQKTERLPIIVRTYEVNVDVMPSPSSDSLTPTLVPFPLADDPALLSGQFEIECN